MRAPTRVLFRKLAMVLHEKCWRARIKFLQPVKPRTVRAKPGCIRRERYSESMFRRVIDSIQELNPFNPIQVYNDESHIQINIYL